MAGRFYAVGVGPGDPELLTLKAVRLIRTCEVVAVPGEQVRETVAYKIAVQACPELAAREILAVPMPMTKDPEVLERSHSEAARTVARELDQGRDVAFLTLGDPTVYATALYVLQRVEALGYDTEIVSGIPSFCAAAARLGIPLVEKAEELHVLPASYQIEAGLALPGTKVLMKAGSKLGQVRRLLVEQGADAVMVENCGMADERVYHGAQEIPEQAGYYTLIVVKEGKEK